MKNAIEKAIEGGYSFLAPERRGEDVRYTPIGNTKFEITDGRNFEGYSIEKILHLASGGDADSFFNELLK